MNNCRDLDHEEMVQMISLKKVGKINCLQLYLLDRIVAYFLSVEVLCFG